MSWVSFDEMAWPTPDGDVEWALRYGTPNRHQLLKAASILSAYQQLIKVPTSAKHLPKIRKILAAAGGPREGEK